MYKYSFKKPSIIFNQNDEDKSWCQSSKFNQIRSTHIVDSRNSFKFNCEIIIINYQVRELSYILCFQIR